MLEAGEQGYLNLLSDIMQNGVIKQDRTGVGTRSVFGRQLRFNMADGFPLLTTKKMFFKGIVVELLWLLSGSTNIHRLVDNGVSIWSAWPHRHYVQQTGINIDLKAFEDRIRAEKDFANLWGRLGPVYGKQWRQWEYSRFVNDIEDPYDVTEYLDQVEKSVELLKTDPNSRRNIVMAWNPADVDEMTVSGLPPCHYMFQLCTEPLSDGKFKLNMMMNMRSCDVFLGQPFNIASYALLLHMYAQVVDMEPGELVITTADTHIYGNHFSQVEEQLKRAPKSLPILELDKSIKCIDDFTLDSFKIVGYDPHPSIKGQVAV